MSSFESWFGALGRARWPTANPAPSFAANCAIDVVAFLIRTSLKVVTLNFLWTAPATRGHCAAVRASLEAH